MNIVGLITEYNPFHNGHLHHIKEAKRITGADAVLVIMSGNFVQRGAPAIMPKHLRAKAALESGADVILELPVCFATGSAESFAAGSINLLNHLGCIDSVCFGSECGDLSALERIAHVTADEPEEYRLMLKQELQQGKAFPVARQQALKHYFQDASLDTLLEHPNNILGIEYLKALYQSDSSIKPYTIKRILSGYHDQELTENCSSASAIRNCLSSSLTEPASVEPLLQLKDQVPDASFQLFCETLQHRYPVFANDFSLLLKYRLLCESRESLSHFLDVSEDLANRIYNRRNQFISFDQFCELLKTRELTYTRISRALLHILLGITKDDLRTFSKQGGCQYARLIGFRKDSREILTEIQRHTSVPLLSKLTKTDQLSSVGLSMLRQDLFASDLYESVLTEKFKTPFISEYCQQIIRV